MVLGALQGALIYPLGALQGALNTLRRLARRPNQEQALLLIIYLVIYLIIYLIPYIIFLINWFLFNYLIV